jgi:hypothetical protein
MDYFPQRKEYPLEDQTRIDKDDEMFGRGGSIDFGNRQTADHVHTLPEAEKSAGEETLLEKGTDGKATEGNSKG